MSDMVLMHARKHQGKPPRNTPNAAHVAPVRRGVFSGQVDTNATTSPTVTVTSCVVGEQLVLKRVRAEPPGTWAAPTSTGGSSVGQLTWTQRVNAAPGSSKCPAEIWTSSPITQAGTVTVTVGTTSNLQGKSSTVEPWSGAATFDGSQRVINVISATTSSYPDLSLLTTQLDNSFVSAVVGDWSSTAPGTTAYYSGATEELVHNLSPSIYVGYHFVVEADLAGPVRVGMRSPATPQNWTMVGIEVQALVSSGPTDYPRSTSDTAAATDSLARALTTARAAGDTAATTDSCVAVVTRGRAQSDAAPAGDVVTRTAQVFARTTTDTGAGTDALTRSTSRARAIADTAAATDATSRTSSRARALADTAPATDGTARAPQALARATGDTAAATDALVRSSTSARSLSDTAPATDVTSASTIGNLSRSQSDSAPAADTTARATALPRTTGDTAAATDATSRATARPRSLADTAAATDTTARTTARARSIADSAPATDVTAASTGGQLARNLSDSAPASDTTTRSKSSPRSTSDSAPAADTSSRSSTRARAIADAAPATDSTSAGTTGNVSRSTSDAAPATDAVVRRVARPRATSDSAAAATDTTARALSQSRALFDLAPIVDLVAAARTQSRLILEHALATDTTSASVTHPTPGPTGQIIASRVVSPVTAAAVVLLRTQGRVHAPDTTGSPITTELTQGVIT